MAVCPSVKIAATERESSDPLLRLHGEYIRDNAVPSPESQRLL